MLLHGLSRQGRAAGARARAKPGSSTPRAFRDRGRSSNAWIVDASGTVITRPNSRADLAGRHANDAGWTLLRRENIPVIERPFRVDEAKAAREAFITSASGTVMPVVRVLMGCRLLMEARAK